ncbi:undecaprenyl-diphosphatase [Lipingzhangella halophila]|uniref:Undecaprenyl-diphosphatase n=1 Tax=Lipingzhangella halophila TaxID=1783352 RepID=A0A7W7W641_9ACTN|nr:phosphatase PAP2 family protein [Lipingzhangella halophila]MBB4935341.1 undecaprenyl-diphosphatase [Lipingzhangella halophila]
MSEIAWGLASDKTAIMLAVALLTMTVLAAGPLHPIDNFVNTYPRPLWDEIRVFLILWLDTVASRFVALPVLGVTALHFAYYHRSWRPVILGVVGVFGMVCLVASMKLLFSRSHPRTYDPSFFSDLGSVSFPSGHGANAILIYGLVLFMIIRYKAARPHVVQRLALCIVGIALLQSAVSVYLHFHWFTDLATGMIAGGLALRLTIRLDRMIPEGRTRFWWPWLGGSFWGGREQQQVHSGGPAAH